MKKLTYKEFKERMYEANAKHEHLKGYIVFKESSFNQSFSLTERTYEVSSEAKAYNPNACGFSLYGCCLDGVDMNVRLERYMSEYQGGPNGWDVEYCYIDDYYDEYFYAVQDIDDGDWDYGSVDLDEAIEMAKDGQRIAKCHLDKNGIVMEVEEAWIKEDGELIAC